ncbi:carbohydrate-responsive element-binding protein isoform X5 [Corvus cornix cornix]|uniref:carbohydrate-responsive element-binding protein isoform X5 n=1 Tax=Corvus cornix cornix TaxID=932674 RepID=UPI00194E4601|nr:carbohydrate-responsive element-binding protein isoform X5 [Corvus cornix cornix]
MGWILLQTTVSKGNVPSCSDHVQCLSQGTLLELGRVPSPAVAPGLPGWCVLGQSSIPWGAWRPVGVSFVLDGAAPWAMCYIEHCARHVPLGLWGEETGMLGASQPNYVPKSHFCHTQAGQAMAFHGLGARIAQQPRAGLHRAGMRGGHHGVTGLSLCRVVRQSSVPVSQRLQTNPQMRKHLVSVAGTGVWYEADGEVLMAEAREQLDPVPCCHHAPEMFTGHRPPPSQTQPGYQDPSCFLPTAEPLFSSGASLMGAQGLPASPEAQLLPGTLLQPSGASQLSLHSAFLGSERPLAPLPPEPPNVAPSSLSPQLRHKPTLQYDLPGKCLSLEPPAPHYVPPIQCPRAPLLSPEPPFSPASAPRSKFPYASSPDPSLVTHPASPLSSPCFTPYIPGLGCATGMGTQGYPSPAASQLLPPALLGNPRFAPHKGLPQGGGGRPKAKPSGTKARRLPGQPLSHLPEPNPCPSQLLTAAKQDLALDTPRPMDAGLMPPAPVSPQQSTVPKVPATFFSRMAQMSPGLAPGSSPSQVVLHTVGTQPGPLQVPKAEQLSPTSACGSDWPKPSQASPGPTARLGTSLSLHHPMSRPGRPESSKLESRRITHISAEQKRRFNIKLGFTMLHSLVSTLSAQPSIKVSKATTLQKTAEYICKLQQERAALQDEAQHLREQIEELNGSINLCQEQLPATGVPITRQRFDHMRRMFDEYVRSSTLQNWKFWIFSIIIRPLFESFNGMVSTASMESLTQTSLAWLDQHCSLPALRPTVLSSLRQLSISTSILSDPARVPEQAARAVAALGRPGASSSSSSSS